MQIGRTKPVYGIQNVPGAGSFGSGRPTQAPTGSAFGTDSATFSSAAGSKEQGQVAAFAARHGADVAPVAALSDTIRPLLDLVWQRFPYTDGDVHVLTKRLTDRLWRARNGESTAELSAAAIARDLGPLFTKYAEAAKRLGGEDGKLLADTMTQVAMALEVRPSALLPDVPPPSSINRLDDARAAFTGLSHNTDATFSVAFALDRAASSLGARASSWGDRGTRLQAALKELSSLATDATAGLSVLPEVVGARMFAVQDAIAEARQGASGDQLAQLIEFEEAVAATLEVAAERFQPRGYQAHWKQINAMDAVREAATKEQEARKAADALRERAATAAYGQYLMTGQLPHGATLASGKVYVPDSPPGVALQMPDWLTWGNARNAIGAVAGVLSFLPIPALPFASPVLGAIASHLPKD